ncbi:GNAT family N-acetyltransferase [Microvirga massiliensis]|uniref:GNAT family N-acetyltransferase n=1 Tax=Microvirga massiliensis TaxID=1033741 RepID=UPI00062BD990|nr:GNAT family N-acetyltransferase [Microvirga massiliensis]
MNLTIRPSRDDDLPAVTAIYADAVLHGTASFKLTPPSEDEMTRRRAVLLDSGYPFLVAECDGAVAGYAYAGAYRSRPAYRSTVEDSIYVAREARRQGVGAALLPALIAACEQLDFRTMIAVIGDSNSAGSIGLHRRCGFREVGILEGVGYKHGRWLDSVLMQRRLGPGMGAPPPWHESMTR